MTIVLTINRFVDGHVRISFLHRFAEYHVKFLSGSRSDMGKMAGHACENERFPGSRFS